MRRVKFTGNEEMEVDTQLSWEGEDKVREVQWEMNPKFLWITGQGHRKQVLNALEKDKG